MPFLGTTGGGSVKQYGGQANLGYFIKNSLRFRSSANSNLSRTPASASNRQTWTWSGWVKRGLLSSGEQVLFSVGSSYTTQTYFTFYIGSDNTLVTSTGTAEIFRTTQLFRDPAAWYHIVLVVDTTQATADNRTRLYINGTEVTSFTRGTNLTQNTDYGINNNVIHYIGRDFAQTIYFDGYIAEVNLIDGQALTPSSFGKTDAATGQWIPKKFAGTYGTNGFYLKFADASAPTAAAIGKDSSLNGNNWTPNNISVTAGATYDAMIDSPTLSASASNYCVLNPLNPNSGTISNGNLNQLFASASYQTAIGTLAMSSGSWYCEVTCTAIGGTGDGVIGIAATQPSSTFAGATATSYGWYSKGQTYNNGTGVSYNGGATWTTNDVIGIAFNATSGSLEFYKNGTSQGVAYSGIPASDYFIGVSSHSSTTYAANFGQRPFAHTPPSGFKSLNTYNLP